MPTEPHNPEQIASLRAAFEAFNSMSDELQDAYRGLQSEVEVLQAKLDAANRRHAAEAQRNAELAGRLAALLEALPAGVVMLDSDGVVRELNAAATDFLGTPLQDAAWSDVRQRAFTREGATEGDLKLHDGRTLSLAQRLLQPGPGRVLLFTDVTEPRKVQQLLARHRRLAAMGEMAAALAHQIRTPLSAALLYTENAARPGLTDEKRESQLAKASRCLHDLEKLIADMLGFARGAGAAQTPLAISDLLDGLRTALAAVTDSGQQVRIADGPAHCEIAGNREALGGALLNLAMNALQHGGPDARVAVDVSERGSQLEIRVRDNGPGVADEYRERIFEPFFTSRPDGTGLGLAVVRSVARAHGGDVVLETGDDEGACFVFHLPLSGANAQASPDKLAEVAA